MKITPHYFVWKLANLYGYLLGWPLFVSLNHLLATLALHGLGYDNADHTGEDRFITKEIAQADIRVALDVGANIGSYSAKLATCLSHATIYAFEPARASFSALKQTASRFAEIIVPINAAVSDYDGTATLFSHKPLSETATLEKTILGTPALSESVAVRTIDSVVAEYNLTRVDFIKIDTEGFEREVLRGAQETLRTLKPSYIQFEFNIMHLYRHVTLLELTELLPGYDFYRLLPHGEIRIDPKRYTSNVFMFSNIVAKRRS